MKQASYTLELHTLIDSLSPESRGKFMQIYIQRMKDPALAVGLNAYLGFFGIDRFYAGDILLGILKLLTAGGFGIWIIVDLFLIAGKVRYRNILLAREIKQSIMSTFFHSPPTRSW